MAIFSRRALQRLIDENANFLGKAQTKKHTDALNFNKKNYKKLLEDGENTNDLVEIYINNEWEIVVLNSLSKFGNLIHEKRIGGSEPDIFFTSSRFNFEFLGDVTCITGKKDQDNVSLAFKDEFKEVIDKENLGGYWKILIRGNSREMDFCNAKPRLMLGGKTQREEIFNSKDFQAFIERVKKSSERKDSFTFTKTKQNPEPRLPNQIELYKNVIVDIEIKYEPSNFYQVEYWQFDDRAIVSIEDDEIYKSLVNKYSQLSKTNYEGCLGIFLCDGIGGTFSRRDFAFKSPRDVIHKFLADHKKIDFVLTLTSESDQYNFYDQTPKIKIALFRGGKGNKLNSKIEQFLEIELLEKFPKPARNISSARSALKSKFADKRTIVPSAGCGLEVSSDELKISSRTLLEVLAGKLPWDKVFYYLGFEGISNSNSIPNRFLTMLNEGNLFSEINIQKGENEKDDDWIVFKFKKDPSISPFDMPDIYK